MIQIRSPEDIKNGLSCCAGEAPCKDCPYYNGNDAKCGSGKNRDALAYIHQLEDQLREVTQKTPQWISVYTQMPKDGQHVLTVNGDGVMEVLYYDEEWPNAFCGCGGLLKVCNITHWRPLPESPKEEENENP